MYKKKIPKVTIERWKDEKIIELTKEVEFLREIVDRLSPPPDFIIKKKEKKK